MHARDFEKYSTSNLALIFSSLLEVANIVLEKGCIQLKQAFEIVRPDVAYKSKNAKRLLLQMPLASVTVGTMSKGTYIPSILSGKTESC